MQKEGKRGGDRLTLFAVIVIEISQGKANVERGAIFAEIIIHHKKESQNFNPPQKNKTLDQTSIRCL